MASPTLFSQLLLLSTCLSHVAADPKVISFPFSRNNNTNPLPRRDAISSTLHNRPPQACYTISLAVGTPPQYVNLDIDTGSSDIWFPSPSVCEHQWDDLACFTSSFNSSQSSTFQLRNGSHPRFIVMYADGSTAEGPTFTDTIDLGNGMKIANQTMALATEGENMTSGIFGLSFASDESTRDKYPTLLDNLFNAGMIKSRTFSLWLNSLQASTGTILFGGYDPAHFIGQPTVLPLLPEDTVNNVSSFTVELSAVALTFNTTTTILNNTAYPVPALLDTGSTLTTLPWNTFQPIAEFFGAKYFHERWLVPCSIGTWSGSIDFGFGNATIIQIPFSELALPVDNFSSGPNEVEMCLFGLEGAEDIVCLGDTFLRSAYVIHDLDSKQIAIAQSRFNSKSSKPREIESGGDLAERLQAARNVTEKPHGEEFYDRVGDFIGDATEMATWSMDGVPKTASISGIKTTLSVVALPKATGVV